MITSVYPVNCIMNVLTLYNILFQGMILCSEGEHSKAVGGPSKDNHYSIF